MVNLDRKHLRMNERRSEIRDWFRKYKKNLEGEICGEENAICLDFHHIKEKNNSVSFMVSKAYAKETILKEISLCLCICSNCHRKIHDGLNIEKYLEICI